jgi:hypothetical protein
VIGETSCSLAYLSVVTASSKATAFSGLGRSAAAVVRPPAQTTAAAKMSVMRVMVAVDFVTPCSQRSQTYGIYTERVGIILMYQTYLKPRQYVIIDVTSLERLGISAGFQHCDNTTLRVPVIVSLLATTMTFPLRRSAHLGWSWYQEMIVAETMECFRDLTSTSSAFVTMATRGGSQCGIREGSWLDLGVTRELQVNLKASSEGECSCEEA